VQIKKQHDDPEHCASMRLVNRDPKQTEQSTDFFQNLGTLAVDIPLFSSENQNKKSLESDFSVGQEGKLGHHEPLQPLMHSQEFTANHQVQHQV